jgi:serine/threonine-protein kinase
MEYLDGVTLARRIEESGRISVREGCAIGRQLADGLDAAHQARIIHRDFKPSNVILTRNPDDTSRAVITDFGLARLSGRQTGTPARTTQPLGTLHYMSPEQADGRPADARSDVYALGIVLWEMFTGNRPLPGEASPRIDAPRLPKSWEQIVLRCVERSPSERFANAGEVRLAMARTA